MSRIQKIGATAQDGEDRTATPTMIIKVLQGNLDRGREATDLLYKIAEEKKADIIIMAEPNRKKATQAGWITDINLDVAIKVINPNIDIVRRGQGSGYVWIKTKYLTIYGCYISPNTGMQSFVDFLHRLRTDMKTHDTEQLVCGDFNAKSYMWGSKFEDKRGEFLTEWLGQEDLIIQNRGSAPTFVRGASQSHIDITFCTKRTSKQLQNWDVLEEESLSYHRHILFEISDNKKQGNINNKRGWRIECKKLGELAEHFHSATRRLTSPILSTEDIINAIKSACNKTFKKIGNSRNKQPVYWWNQQVAEARRACLRSKRELSRANKGKDERQKRELLAKYRKCRTDLKNTIWRAKKSAWKDVINEVDSDVWGKGYQIVRKRFKKFQPIAISDEIQLDVAKALFPNRQVTRWERLPTEIQNIPKFTLEELLMATCKIKVKKAPGPDAFTPEVVKTIVTKYPDTILPALNEVLTRGEFPTPWKLAKLVLIEKPKPVEGSQKYRPICLLNVLGKIIEYMILRRLEEEINRKGGLSPNQYGFVKGKSTIHALKEVQSFADRANRKSDRKLCALVTVDVQNAFNSAPWDGILKVLRTKKVDSYLYNILASYLEDRKLLIGKHREMQMTCGVPQGSILGPLLWNLYYDDILGICPSSGTKLIGYADDLAIIVTAKKVEELKAGIERTLRKVSEWMTSRELKLAPQKTEVVLLVAGRKVKSITVEIENLLITSVENIRYLGVYLDRNMRMGHHIRKTAEKAVRALGDLSCLLPNIGGPREGNRRILCSVVNSIILYGDVAWKRALDKKIYNGILLAVQRKVAIRITRAYRTVSTGAILVVARYPPIHFLVEQREDERRRDKRTAYTLLINKWQEHWQEAASTGNLIPTLQPWIDRKHGEMTYHLTQLITGHGCFQAYRKRFKVAETEECVYCGNTDTVEHTFFECPRWEPERRSMEERIGSVTPENITSKMLVSQEKWNAVSNFAKSVIDSKEKYIRQHSE